MQSCWILSSFSISKQITFTLRLQVRQLDPRKPALPCPHSPWASVLPLTLCAQENRPHTLFHLTCVSLCRCCHGGVKCSPSSNRKARQFKGILGSFGLAGFSSPFIQITANTGFMPDWPMQYAGLPPGWPMLYPCSRPVSHSSCLVRPATLSFALFISHSDGSINRKHDPTHSVLYKWIFHTETLDLSCECGSHLGTMMSYKSSPGKLLQRSQSRKIRLN